MNQLVGACDVGGSNLRVALATRDGTLIARRAVAHSHPAPDATVERIASTLETLAQSAGATLLAIGAAVPGPLDPISGIVHFSPNLAWRDFPFAQSLSARLDLPIAIDDDANCAALGEQWLGSGSGIRDFLYVIVGTGIGAGLILDGQLYRGARGLAGELGHTTIVPDGPLCNCGNRGCVEALAAGPAIVARLRECLGASAPEDLTTHSVIAAARNGDALARQVITQAGEYLGIALANAVNLLNPERIGIGGGVAQDAGEMLLEPARRVMRQRAFADAAESLQVTLGRLGDDAGLIGAARLGWERVR